MNNRRDNKCFHAINYVYTFVILTLQINEPLWLKIHSSKLSSSWFDLTAELDLAPSNPS